MIWTFWDYLMILQKFRVSKTSDPGLNSGDSSSDISTDSFSSHSSSFTTHMFGNYSYFFALENKEIQSFLFLSSFFSGSYLQNVTTSLELFFSISGKVIRLLYQIKLSNLRQLRSILIHFYLTHTPEPLLSFYMIFLWTRIN